MKSFKSAGLILFSALTLAGCGGGGGGDSVELVTLDGGNAVEAASTTYYATSSADMASAMAISMVGIATVQQPGSERFVLRDFANEQLDKLSQIKSQLASNMVTAAALYNGGGQCSGGGTASFTWNDADDNGNLSTGDTFTFTFTNCVEAEGTINGSLTITGLTIIGDPYFGPYSRKATLKFSKFRVSAGGESLGVNGSYMVSLATDDQVTFTTTASSSSLSFVHTVATDSRTITLRDYSATSIYDANTRETSVTFKETIVDSVLGGGIAIATLTPFKIGYYDSYPYTGSLMITGKNNSSITLTAIDSTNVDLDIDADGDGAAEVTIHTTWVALDS